MTETHNNTTDKPLDIVEQVAQTPDLLERVLQTPQASGFIGMMIERSHSGPLPTANELKKYDQIIPNGAERIMKMAEREQAGRINHRGWALFIKGMGLVFALISVILVLWFCFTLVSKEQYGLATTVMLGVLASLAGVFAIGKNISQKDKDTEESE